MYALESRARPEAASSAPRGVVERQTRPLDVRPEGKLPRKMRQHANGSIKIQDEP